HRSIDEEYDVGLVRMINAHRSGSKNMTAYRLLDRAVLEVSGCQSAGGRGVARIYTYLSVLQLLHHADKQGLNSLIGAGIHHRFVLNLVLVDMLHQQPLLGQMHADWTGVLLGN